MPESRRRDGGGQEFLVPQQRDLPTLGREPGNGAGTKTDALQMWKRGSPKADHAPKATPQWVRSGGDGSTKAVGFMPRRTRHR